jgi:hypothetical protein
LMLMLAGKEGADEKKPSDRDDESRQIPVVRRGIM